MAYVHPMHWSSYSDPEGVGYTPYDAYAPLPAPFPCLPPSSVRDVYVSNLPDWATDDWLREQFQDTEGVVITAQVLPGGAAGKPYGFVQIEEPLAPPDGSPPSSNLYANGLPLHFTERDVGRLFGQYGPVCSLVVLRDAARSTSRGTAMVQFYSTEAATSAMYALNGVLLPGHDRPLEVRYARNPHQKGASKAKAPTLAAGRGHPLDQPTGSWRRDGVATKAKSPPPSSKGTSSRSACGSESISDIHSVTESASVVNDDATLCLGLRELEEGLQALAESEDCGLSDADEDRGTAAIPAAALSVLRDLDRREGKTSPVGGAKPESPIPEEIIVYPGAPTAETQQPPAEISNVYISNLPMPKDDDWLSALFARFGPILSAKVMLTRRASDKPYGFVQFTEPAMARAAVAAMDGAEVEGSMLHVKLADREKHAAGQNPSADIYISNLPLDYGAQEIAQMFGRCGGISSLVVLTDDRGRSRGLAVIHFFKPESAAAAIAKWHGHTLPGHSRPVEVMFAKAKHCRAAGKHRAVTNIPAPAPDTQPPASASAAAASTSAPATKQTTSRPQTPEVAATPPPVASSVAQPALADPWGAATLSPKEAAGTGCPPAWWTTKDASLWWPGKGVW
eukprot:EG_transcript_920